MIVFICETGLDCVGLIYMVSIIFTSQGNPGKSATLVGRVAAMRVKVGFVQLAEIYHREESGLDESVFKNGSVANGTAALEI